MSKIHELLKEMEQEANTTRKMLSIVPDDKYDWKPHPKSMSIRQLAGHIAEISGWIKSILTTTELDFATAPYTPPPVNNTKELLAFFEQKLVDGTEQLKKATDEDLLPIWTMRRGEQILAAFPKGDNIRHCFCQVVHHRAQLGVYLRLLDVPIPGSYGPSADEMNF